MSSTQAYETRVPMHHVESSWLFAGEMQLTNSISCRSKQVRRSYKRRSDPDGSPVSNGRSLFCPDVEMSTRFRALSRRKGS